MKVCVIAGPFTMFSLANPDLGIVASYFGSSREAEQYAVSQGWEIY